VLVVAEGSSAVAGELTVEDYSEDRNVMVVMVEMVGLGGGINVNMVVRECLRKKERQLCLKKKNREIIFFRK
jgi:hypothetical protein